MKDVLTSRADLLWALHTGGSELQEAVAHVLGLEERIVSVEARTEVHLGSDIAYVTPTAQTVSPPAPAAVDVPFWQADTYVARQPLAATDEPRRTTDEASRPPLPVRAPLAFAPLASRAELLTRLRRVSAFWESGAELDLDCIVDRLSRGELLRHLPRRLRKRWGQSIQVIVDRSRRLVPYWTDQEIAVQDVQRVYPRGRFQLAILPEGESEPLIRTQTDRLGPYALPESGAHVLVLGDLGCLARDQGATEQWWLEWGQRFQANGNQPLALLPCRADRCPAPLAEVWTILPWESSGGPAAPLPSPDGTDQLIRRILTLLSFALRVEPQLIRAVRRTQPECRWDPGIESLVWQDEAFLGRLCDAAAFDPARAQELQAQLRQFSPAERYAVYELVAAMHQGTYEGVWYSELLGLEHEVATGLVSAAEHDRAVEWFERENNQLAARKKALDLAGSQAAWHRRASAVLAESAYHGPAARPLHEIWSLVHPRDEGTRLPAHLDPALLLPTGPESTLVLSQVSNILNARPFQPGESLGSPLALIRTRHGRIRIDEIDPFWEGGTRPDWAREWDYDQLGAWATFEVGGATQKMRWVPPGKFLMGSPENEVGRRENEGPQHDVEIKRGFWIFQTPCTQTLWQAVMGENQSYFKGPTRPVENVSWNDVQSFLAEISKLVPGLRLELPTEQRWEYACRAGTMGARYAEALSEIASFWENSSQGTDPVGGKRPNAWGLHDMLGNVWEWCADEYRSYGTDAAEPSADRVLRGGSWSNYARNVRAATRSRYGSGRRSYYIGFRCAEFSSPGPAGRVERAASRSQWRAEPRGDDELGSGTRWLDLAGRGETTVAFPALVPVRVLSDLDELTIRTLT
jgi:formylglycine-generating enzyme required for sulfatase activity